MQLLYLLFVLIGLVLFVAAFLYRPKHKAMELPSPETIRSILKEEVAFYQDLPTERRVEFETRVHRFLGKVKITAVRTKLDALDQVLVAASAVIPIFGYSDWEYPNLHEVLLYPDRFDEKFRQEGHSRDTLGMVGSGAYKNVMILSQQALRESFSNKTGKTNAGIHEFVHLVDSTDGSFDGLPETVLQKKYVLPWLKLMHEEMKNIEAGHSDINPYALTNEAEFYAVISEYFFSRPDLLKEKHPELYEQLARIFGGNGQAG